MFEEIISIKNLLQSWREFLPGKKAKPDVAEFALHLSANIYQLHQELKNKIYTHGHYEHFKISDPKPRDIHKASVRDRLLHHAIHRILYPYFDRKFIADSYSCRVNKGTHKAMDRFRAFAYKVSKNHTRTAWVLKCDIKKFFASIDHITLKQILARHITDQDTLWLLGNVIDSFRPKADQPRAGAASCKGLPLGNLTSQLLVNIYMNQFDQFVKHALKVKHYIRYADDFVILSRDRDYLKTLIPVVRDFLEAKLKLTLHPTKLFLKTLSSGIDFLGWVHFPNYRVLRTSTKRRMLRNLEARRLSEREGEVKSEGTLSSYLGMLGWGNAWKICHKIGP